MFHWRKILIAVVVLMLCVVVACFFFRNSILQRAFAKAQKRMAESYHTQLTARSLAFTGIDRISLRDVTLLPEEEDTLLQVAHVDVDISLLHLLHGKVAIDHIVIDSALLTMYHEPDRDNMSVLRVKSKDNTSAKKPLTFREKVEGYESKLFRALNTAFELHHAVISYQDTSHAESLYVPSFSYDKKILSGMIINLRHPDTITMTGQVIKRNKAYQCTIEHHGNDSIYLPFADGERGLRCRFHRITADLTLDNSGDHFRIGTDGTVDDFHIRHWRLAAEDVVMAHARCRTTLTFTDHGIELDSTSLFTLGSASCSMSARYQFDKDTIYALGIHMPEIAADSFFGALPGGMFHTLRGISCAGTLAYDLKFELHTSAPDSLIFQSALRGKNLHIRHYGAENYAKINGPFLYEAYDHGKLVRQFVIGESNPYYTPLSQMSPYISQAVMQGEDPSFMQHRGFLTESFRESIAQNYKEHRFARGGSTISMQLVKNVFLSRDKTISRKVEEALIVYLIENLGLVPKERMLEVYLNAIEWGPNVYGIGEASRFYFDKRPSGLTLAESIFLAHIVPRPKAFRWQFDNNGELHSSLAGYFRIISTRMVWRGVLNPSDTVGLEPKVTLRGPAKAFFNSSDSSSLKPTNDDDDDEQIIPQPTKREIRREERKLKREKRREARKHKSED